MQVSFERSGGFTGIPVTLTLDTAALPAHEATELQRLVDAAGFFALPETSAASGQPDRFHYRITIRDGDRHHTVTVGEAAAPDTLKPLLTWLTQAARKH